MGFEPTVGLVARGIKSPAHSTAMETNPITYMFSFTSILITPVLSEAVVDVGDDIRIDGADTRDRTRLAPLRKARPPRGIGDDGASAGSSTQPLPVPRGAYQPNRWLDLCPKSAYKLLTKLHGFSLRIHAAGLVRMAGIEPAA